MKNLHCLLFGSLFLIKSVGSTNYVTEQSVKNLHCDGAYNNPSISEFSSHNKIDIVLTGIQVFDGRYNLEPMPGGLQVIDTITVEIIQAKKVTSSKQEKWSIKTEDGYRYFTPKEINISVLRKKLKNRTEEELQKRNNVEATIFQLCFPIRNNKTRYGLLVSHQLWAYCRSTAINLVRITNYIETIHQRTSNVACAEAKKVFSTVLYSLLDCKNNIIYKVIKYQL